uniref:Uncharacterized protein n=1 Tax=Tetraselmis sp. GSL018 TaxID=582737 RepID=A0A061S1G7_9CHLO|mmetsp:Transcript_17008/g.40577  ORF Transcript_17008/g.40577 Transcript_17008/m.40577 type:complete len:150 (-) Transcript_17008:162-611(-)
MSDSRPPNRPEGSTDSDALERTDLKAQSNSTDSSTSVEGVPEAQSSDFQSARRETDRKPSKSEESDRASGKKSKRRKEDKHKSSRHGKEKRHRHKESSKKKSRKRDREDSPNYSVVSGKKIKLKVRKSKDDKLREKTRAHMLEMLNAKY